METDAFPNAAKPKSRRRWYQYSLRTLLIVVTLAGCGFSWLAIKVREAREQQAAVEAILKLHGRVAYDYEYDANFERIPNALPPGPAWLHALLGDDFCRNVYLLGLSDRPVSAGDLERIRGFKKIKRLYLDDTQVTDAGLECLSGLTQLRELSLDRTQVTDAGLDQLSGLTNLDYLWLRGTKVTAAGVARLREKLPHCNILRQGSDGN